MAKSRRRKHIPQRMCVVCRRVMPKRELVRIVRTPDGIAVDSTGKMPGRGAYLCRNPDCWEKACKSDVLGKALRTIMTEDDRKLLRESTPQHSSQEQIPTAG